MRNFGSQQLCCHPFIASRRLQWGLLDGWEKVLSSRDPHINAAASSTNATSTSSLHPPPSSPPAALSSSGNNLSLNAINDIHRRDYVHTSHTALREHDAAALHWPDIDSIKPEYRSCPEGSMTEDVLKRSIMHAFKRFDHDYILSRSRGSQRKTSSSSSSSSSIAMSAASLCSFSCPFSSSSSSFIPTCFTSPQAYCDCPLPAVSK
mmetsp:Transcript_37804/g.61466  ORF Transcript_37804/g.61466 Transcript_37804/m.61466 type:complete len:206 (+) Transcript_37804:1351-1968(+)